MVIIKSLGGVHSSLSKPDEARVHRLVLQGLRWSARAAARAVVLRRPPIGDGVDGYRIQEVELVAPAAPRAHQIGGFKNGEVLGNRLSGDAHAV